MNMVHSTFQGQATQGMASREQALAELQKIAEYFQQTEPHSLYTCC